ENIEGKNIKIEQVHEFIRKIQLKPYASLIKVGVIIRSEKMTSEAQNALLKTIEEPPTNTIILLTTSNKSKLIQTIPSRCQVFESFKMEDAAMNEAVIKEILGNNIIYRFSFVEDLLK